MKTSLRSIALLAALSLARCSSAESSNPSDDGAPPEGATGSAGGAGGGGGSGAGGDTTPPQKPANVIFILTDDLSWNLVQYMPHVLEMRKKGVTFTNYFVTDSLCCPSRTSILTGMFPHDSGVFTNTGDDGGYATFNAKGNQKKTFASALSASGYRTALMGKYLNGYEPTTLAIPKGWTNWAGAGAGYKEFDYDLNQDGKLHHYGHTDEDYLTDVVAGLGAAFVGKDPGKPFLLEIATFTPHGPYIPAPRHADLFPGLTVPHTPAYGAAPGPNAPSWLKAISPLTAKDKQDMNVSFRMRAQSVQAIDEMIGALEDAVEAAGQSNNTYFVFTSDNGYHMGEHLLRPGKQTAFDTDIRVPLIVTGPGVVAGKDLDAIAQNIDLCPTFAELGLADPPPSQTGRSLVPLLRGETSADWRDAALIEHHGKYFDPDDPDAAEPDSGAPPTYSALRTKNAVYVEYVGGEREYYAHDTDPDELHNTVGKLSSTEVAALHDTLEAMTTCHDAASCWSAQHLLPGAP